MLRSEDKQSLLRLARKSIRHGLEEKSALQPDPGDFPETLRQDGASFVTLRKRDDLRGCIGSVRAYRPLVIDVAENAWNAAFRDPRFPGLSRQEFSEIDLHVSLLSEPLEMQFTDEKDLLGQVVPGRDGLIIEDGFRRGLFLPSVWEQLPELDLFWTQLKRKAGLRDDHWSSTLTCKRFYSYEFGEDD